MEGWISLHRKILENPVVCKDSDHMAVWMYLLLNATHKEYQSMFMGKKILLQPGQLITGRKTIAEKFNIDESKVQRILKRFENEQQIEQQNGNKNRLITVVSWSTYQNSEQQNEQQMNNNCTTTEQQVNTYNNVNNDNKEISKDIKDLSAQIKDLRSRYSDSMNLVLDEYLQFIAETRSGKKIADSIVVKILEYFNNHSPVIVECAVKTHMNMLDKKSAKENYTFGILRGLNGNEEQAKVKLYLLEGSKEAAPSKQYCKQSFEEFEKILGG